MKLWAGLALLGALVLTVSGCEWTAPEQGESPPVELLEVKDMHGSLEGLGQMDEFMQKAAKGNAIAVRVTHFTIEGDPIYHEVYYDGQGSYQVRYDTTKDKFGHGEVNTYGCGNFVKTETSVSTAYTAEKCTGGQERIAVLDIGYDAAVQDRFEFELQYGANGENMLRSSELSKQQLQDAYKQLVLAGYLNVKDLTTACKEEPNERYKMKVWINSGTLEYEWASCDNSTNGKALTAIARRLSAMKKGA